MMLLLYQNLLLIKWLETKKEKLFAKMTFDIGKTKTAQQFLYENKKEGAMKALESKISPNDSRKLF